MASGINSFSLKNLLAIVGFASITLFIMRQYNGFGFLLICNLAFILTIVGNSNGSLECLWLKVPKITFADGVVLFVLLLLWNLVISILLLSLE